VPGGGKRARHQVKKVRQIRPNGMEFWIAPLATDLDTNTVEWKGK